MDPLLFDAYMNPDSEVRLDDGNGIFVKTDLFKGDIYSMGITLYKIVTAGMEVKFINKS